MFATSSVKWRRAINEKDRVIDVVFFVEFCERPIYESIVSCRIKLCTWLIVEFKINDSVQPIQFIVKLNHSLSDGIVIQASTSSGCRSAL